MSKISNSESGDNKIRRSHFSMRAMLVASIFSFMAGYSASQYSQIVNSLTRNLNDELGRFKNEVGDAKEILEIEKEIEKKDEEPAELFSEIENEDIRTRFMFLLGTEGSGHHLFKSLYNKSPVKHFLHKVGVTPEDISLILWNQQNKKQGLFSSVFAPSENVDGDVIFRKLVNSLKAVDARIRSSSVLPPPAGWSVPMNSISKENNKTGMMSYPNFGGEAKSLQFPDLSALNAACEEARVECEYVILHRNVYETLHSVLRRDFYTSMLRATKTFSSMVALITVDMLKFPEKIAGCWDAVGGEGVGVVARRLGWDPDEDVWRATWGEYNSTKSMTLGEQDKVVPKNKLVYVDSLIASQKVMVNNCHRLLEQRKRNGILP